MHWALAITNACNALRYVTRFSCDICKQHFEFDLHALTLPSWILRCLYLPPKGHTGIN